MIAKSKSFQKSVAARLPLILASSSPRRRALLRQAGIAFTIVRPAYEEGAPTGRPGTFVLAAARAKAADVFARVHRPAWILAADTLVICGARVFGKPRTRHEADVMLQALAGRTHRVMTGVALWAGPRGRRQEFLVTTRVHMRAVNARERVRYLESGEWRGKAGAYAIQGRAGAWIDAVTGCYNNVVGLPLAAVCARLEALRAGSRS